MMTVPIVDGIFTHTGAKSIGVSDEHPTYFQWKRDLRNIPRISFI